MSHIKILFIILMLLFFGYLINKILLLKHIKENEIIFSDAKFQGSIVPLNMIEGNIVPDNNHREGMLSMFGASSMNSEYSSVAK